MRLNGVLIEETFAEAFPMLGTRLIVTADSPAWVQAAAVSMTGFATSVIGCGCEAAVERLLPPEETPDGRPGAAVLLFSVSREELAKQVVRRVGQCVMTSPGSACYAGLRDGPPIPLGNSLRYFGDGWQIAKRIGGRRYWRIPVMDGEFLCEATTAVVEGVGGGNFIILAADRHAALVAAQAAVMAIREVPGAILPFPGGVVRSGSKIGSKYKGLIASTNTAFCPTLRPAVHSLVPEGVGSILELVIDAVNPQAITAAMRAGIAATAGLGAAAGVVAVTAGNYGGKLGRHQFHLHEVMA
ncbi:formylmethanofuran--tetrahydromethanopterin N-formyltransferase [Azospirillum sp. RWY-5-1]|uniref:Formylmethanofuran--tetrahydromethanopterin formyltransferase n=1 Tax=Azospirillum oleiclasticum TaxID=2735135 RepID=A0ABX2TG73_9PROT|nr:formylmethanofuran--tetrahydromethanopterin N-formyltransferase [Azospirillum oleiclasticum]NYZ14479.1 formylmethanofuran--tetrahydromethanopterin N-formyltransferase [Azospirillum oleiclasticum]NYZ23169.1 formylmethanofuran--tetrahydromethanopterin N-formyltransferase [Azospirillum oleiclasticum]